MTAPRPTLLILARLQDALAVVLTWAVLLLVLGWALRLAVVGGVR